MTLLENKIIHYNLNLSYARSNNAQIETNALIQRTLNDFLNHYEKEIKTHIFIMEYQDDILSVICYKMLISIFTLYNIKLVLCGCRHKTKKMINKKQKFISKRKATKLINNNKAILISVFNPIYEVVDNNKNFKNLDLNIWYPIKNFTPIQLITAREFYKVGYIKHDIIEHPNVQEFNNWCNTKGTNVYSARIKVLPKNQKLNNYKEKIIHLIKLTDNIEHNQIVLNEVEKENGLFFYQFSENVNPYDNEIYNQLISFSYFIKNNSNTFGYYNWCGKENDRGQVNINLIATALQAKIIVHEYKEAIK